MKRTIRNITSVTHEVYQKKKIRNIIIFYLYYDKDRSY